MLSILFLFHVKAEFLGTLKKTDLENLVRFHNPNQNFPA